jgi:hypothetical protein
MGQSTPSIPTVRRSGTLNWTSAGILDDGTLYIGSMHSSSGYNGRLLALETTSMGYAVSPWPRFRHDHKNTGRFGAD